MRRRSALSRGGWWPVACPASAILLLWLLGTGWSKLPRRHEALWSPVLRVTAWGVREDLWGCGAGAF